MKFDSPFDYMSTARMSPLPDKWYKHDYQCWRLAVARSNSKIFLIEVHLDGPTVPTMSFN